MLNRAEFVFLEWPRERNLLHRRVPVADEPHQTSRHPELANYKQTERMSASPVPSGSARPSAHLQEHTHTAPNALAHISAAGNAGMGSLSLWGNFHWLESILLWRARYISLLTSANPSSYSYGLLLQAFYVFSVNNRRNGDVSAFFYTFL